MQYIKECFDIREALKLDKSDNFDVLNDTEDLLQVRCKEGRFVAEGSYNKNLVTMLQGNEIFIWHKQKLVSNGNGFIYHSLNGMGVTVYFEDLSHLLI